MTAKAKARRNDPCPCGRGKKYKRCCGEHSGPPTSSTAAFPPEVQQVLERHRAQERIRETQQGRGNPIISVKHRDQQVVAVGNRLFWSPTWKTFPDFLSDYLKQILGEDWGNAEIAKPLQDRHPLMQWYDAYCRYQRAFITKPGEVSSAPMVGLTVCYLGLAYNLYLLHHNVELQERLVRRLRDARSFQGAYYELIVANTLIRAGFTLTLEDETNGASKHCEFAAVSKRTGKKYWVEAKMRAVIGFFGKTAADGSNDPNPLSRLVPHLNDALSKPAADERLIFIDLNTDSDAAGIPAWGDRAAARLEQYEAKELTPGVSAYVFVTNLPFHRDLEVVTPIAGLPFGLGIADFNRPGQYRVSEIYRRKLKHIDAHDILDSLVKYPAIPTTFDGSLPSEAFGRQSSRVVIGETYFFEHAREGGLVGTVTSATVSEPEMMMYVGITDQEGQAHILRQPMSEAELADYKAHSDAYFGRVELAKKKAENVYELFEWLLDANRGRPRNKMLEELASRPDIDELRTVTDEELLIAYCEGLAAAINMQRPGDQSSPPAAPIS